MSQLKCFLFRHTALGVGSADIISNMIEDEKRKSEEYLSKLAERMKEHGVMFDTGTAHDKTNTMTCAPSEDSDQIGYPPSLIRILAVHLKMH